MGLESNLTLAGNFKRHGVFDYMMRSKILLHTSSFESFGMVFNEALYYGLNIVSKPVEIAEATNRWQICNSEGEFIKTSIMINVKNQPSIDDENA